MLTGKRFKLQKPTQAVDVIDVERSAVTIPVGAIIEVAADPNDGDGLVDVLWEGRTVVMFATDLNVRGAEITSQSARLKAVDQSGETIIHDRSTRRPSD